MTFRKQGYPLPDGVLGQDEIACTLVFYPNRKKYRDALQGSLAYLATWIAWEKDEDRRGRDAADNWREAYELTTRCWEMACLEQLQTDVNAIFLLLQQADKCCSDFTSYEVTTTITTIIVPGEGDDPTVYGETAVANWAEWLEHLCYQAHQYVDRLISYGRVIDAFFVSGGLTLDAWSHALNILQFSALPIPFYIVDALEWLSDFFLGVSDSWFDDVADDLEAAREDIVCTIMQGGDLEAAVEAAISSGLAWTLFYNLIDYEQVQALLYKGGWEDEFLPTELRDDCDTCGYEQETDSSLFIEWHYADSHSYDEEEKEWTAHGYSVGSCENVSFTLWETASKLVKKPCKVVVTSCTGGAKCSSLDNTLGKLTGVEVYSYDHPPLPDLTYGLVDYYRTVHVPAVPFDITFKLYSVP